MKGRIALLVGVGLTAWLAGLVASLPADRALAWFAPAGVQAAGVTGTAWHGRAERIATGGGVSLQRVRWAVPAWRLVSGTVAADARFRVAGLAVSGRFARDLDGALHGRAINVRGPVAGLGALLPGPAVAFGGDLLARVDRIVLADGRIETLAGRVQWSDAAVDAFPGVALGRVRATIEAAADGPGHRLTLEARDGAVDVAGRVRLEPDGRYSVDLELTPTADAPPGLRDALALVAQPAGAGYRLRRSGRWPLPGG